MAQAPAEDGKPATWLVHTQPGLLGTELYGSKCDVYPLLPAHRSWLNAGPKPATKGLSVSLNVCHLPKPKLDASSGGGHDFVVPQG